MELNYTDDNNIYPLANTSNLPFNYAPLSDIQDNTPNNTINYTYMVTNLDNNMDISSCNESEENNISNVIKIKNNLINIINNCDIDIDINASEVESSEKIDKLSELYDEFIKEYLLEQNEFLKYEKKLNKVLQETKSNIKKLDLIIKFINEIDDGSCEGSLFNILIENMKLLSSNIEENNKLKYIKEEYINSKKKINKYLRFIKKINNMNIANVCPLCLNNSVNLYLTCGHTCCEDCYERLSNNNEKKCFLCRKIIFDKRPLYFS